MTLKDSIGEGTIKTKRTFSAGELRCLLLAMALTVLYAAVQAQDQARLPVPPDVNVPIRAASATAEKRSVDRNRNNFFEFPSL